MSHNSITVNGTEPNVAGEIAAGGRQMILVGRGLQNSYSNSPASGLSAGSTLYFYDTSPVNTIPNATISSSSGWVSSVTLPAGNYVILGYFSALFSSSGSLEFVWYKGAARVGNGAVIGALTLASLDGSRLAQAAVTITTTSTFTLKVLSSSNVSALASQGNIPSEESWVMIEKV